MDIALNEHFDVFLDDTNDLAIVTGRDAFEQRLVLGLTEYFHELVGTINQTELIRLLEVRANRLVQDVPEIVSIADLRIALSTETPNTIEVTVVYETDDATTFSLTE